MSPRILVLSVCHDKKFQHLEFHIVDLENQKIHRNVSPPLFSTSGFTRMLSLCESIYIFGGYSTSEDVADIDSYVSQNPTDTFYMGSAHMRLAASDSVGEWCKHPKPIFGHLFANSTCLHGKIYNMGFHDLDPQLFDPTSDSWESITLPSELQGCFLSMFAMPDPSHDRIILHLERGSLPSPSIYAYYPSSDEWKLIVSDFSDWDPVSAVADGVIYFNYYKCHTLVAAYDLKSLKWLDVHLSDTVVDGSYILINRFKELLYLGDNSFCLSVHSLQIANSNSIRVSFVKFTIERTDSVINIIPQSASHFILPHTSYLRNMIALS
ncbi:uncharacterized protein LOC123906661 [Trifolium pratense]|uniref:Uncharacterized protein n=2 Tax=Trifolium pratense TaxID=57577 RepID=A0ACB0JIV2_TRIPR|nr:uncharacterized protein LOC123906661 [Trifolium pratense]XP_045812585.1 uncharacterized protein LOC123906661 [Trifolium pratense]CAJ2633236.1 unnamed protein product [Trifolium pratense]CAJ2644764.1 unnamed protein product [Trifolium pratense]